MERPVCIMEVFVWAGGYTANNVLIVIVNTTAIKQSIAYYHGDIYFKQGDPIRVRETVLWIQ